MGRKVRQGFPFKSADLRGSESANHRPWGVPLDSENFRNRIINSKVSINTGSNGIDAAAPFLQFSGTAAPAHAETSPCTALILYQSPDTIIGQAVTKAAREAQKAKLKSGRDLRYQGLECSAGPANWNCEGQNVTPRDFGAWSWADLRRTPDEPSSDAPMVLEGTTTPATSCTPLASELTSTMQCESVGSFSMESSYKKWECYAQSLDPECL
mmetsp:Transcript_7941/g.12602  ORF Transcript_7941/g.12602 Transcript_7941/m.12602 type:complete len:212 (-) Transcript_7941:147-782(-)